MSYVRVQVHVLCLVSESRFMSFVWVQAHVLCPGPSSCHVSCVQVQVHVLCPVSGSKFMSFVWVQAHVLCPVSCVLCPVSYVMCPVFGLSGVSRISGVRIPFGYTPILIKFSACSPSSPITHSGAQHHLHTSSCGSCRILIQPCSTTPRIGMHWSSSSSRSSPLSFSSQGY